VAVKVFGELVKRGDLPAVAGDVSGYHTIEEVCSPKALVPSWRMMMMMVVVVS
jgi:hypothetical protein